MDIKANYHNFEDKRFLALPNEVIANDLLWVVNARPDTVLHEPYLDRMPRQ